MRSLVAAFLIPLFVALPVTQVLAQATQEEPQVTQTSEATVLLSTPVVDSNTVLLLAPGSVEFSPATDSLPLLDPTAAAISTGGKIALVVVGILVVLALIAFIVVCSGSGSDNPYSPCPS